MEAESSLMDLESVVVNLEALCAPTIIGFKRAERMLLVFRTFRDLVMEIGGSACNKRARRVNTGLG